MKRIILVTTLFIILTSCFFYSDIEDFVCKQRQNGLINFDYGIISMEDLNKANERVLVSPFDGTHMNGFSYWQCFNKKYLKMKCDYGEPFDEPWSLLNIDIETDSEVHSYYTHHHISGEICDELISKINTSLENRTFFCINGTDGALDRITSKREYSWVFHRLKSRSGYVHYFIDDYSDPYFRS